MKSPDNRERDHAERGRLLSRPGASSDTEQIAPGQHRLGLAPRRDGFLYVPRDYRPERPAPLAVMLHGAGGNASGGLAPLLPLADAEGLILLAVDSRGSSWDVIRGGYGVDVRFLDRALAHTFARYAIDMSRLAIGGFSDGASYALSVGITNGDLFSHIIAFSPGFMLPASQSGLPRIYISHGNDDRILAIDRCSRRLVPQLINAGYSVLYHEFDGGHDVPPDIAREAAGWFQKEPSAA